MRLKTYRDSDLATALERARAELGPRAIVLATRETRGPLGLPVTEVTVGVEREAPLRAPLAETPDRPPLDEAVATLSAAGVPHDLARRFARVAAARHPGRLEAPELCRAAARELALAIPLTPSALRSRRLFLVGPPGSGKTTSAAKLAARHALLDERRVILAGADTARVGAMQQSSLISRHIGADFVPIEEEHDLVQALRRAKPADTVVIDTPGVGRADLERLEQLLGLRAVAPEADLVVLLPAGLQRAEAAATLQRFACLEPTCVGLSRIDDARGIGELLAVVEDSGLPLGFVTNGHRIPDDMHRATADALAGWVLEEVSP